MSMDENDSMHATCSCGAIAFDPKPCEECANPRNEASDPRPVRPNRERLCSDCRSTCAECEEECCVDHKDPNETLCQRCFVANQYDELRTYGSYPGQHIDDALAQEIATARKAGRWMDMQDLQRQAKGRR